MNLLREKRNKGKAKKAILKKMYLKRKNKNVLNNKLMIRNPMNKNFKREKLIKNY